MDKDLEIRLDKMYKLTQLQTGHGSLWTYTKRIGNTTDPSIARRWMTEATHLPDA